MRDDHRLRARSQLRDDDKLRDDHKLRLRSQIACLDFLGIFVQNCPKFGDFCPKFGDFRGFCPKKGPSLYITDC